MDIRIDQIVRGVRPKGHLKSDSAREKLITILADRLRSAFASGLDKLAHDPDLLLLVSRCIRNAGVDKHGFDEAELVCEVMRRLFPDRFDPQRLEQMRAIWRCFNDNKCIKKLSRCQRTYHWLFPAPGNES